MSDTSREDFTEEQWEKILELLRMHLFASIPVPANEAWKLRVWERENPGLAGRAKESSQ